MSTNTARASLSETDTPASARTSTQSGFATALVYMLAASLGAFADAFASALSGPASLAADFFDFFSTFVPALPSVIEDTSSSYTVELCEPPTR